jgi:hypothetical protein
LINLIHYSRCDTKFPHFTINDPWCPGDPLPSDPDGGNTIIYSYFDDYGIIQTKTIKNFYGTGTEGEFLSPEGIKGSLHSPLVITFEDGRKESIEQRAWSAEFLNALLSAKCSTLNANQTRRAA